mgnify:CR=1 FL=1
MLKGLWFMVMIITICICLMVVILISNSNNGYGNNLIVKPPSTEVMIPTPTSIPKPTRTPMPTKVPYKDIEKDLVLTLVEFNGITNNFTAFMGNITNLLEYELITSPGASVITRQALNIYSDTVHLYDVPDFESRQWGELEEELKQMKQAEIVKINKYEKFAVMMQQGYRTSNQKIVEEARQNIIRLAKSDTNDMPFWLQYRILKKYKIDPFIVNFLYWDEFHQEQQGFKDDTRSPLTYIR